MLPLILLAVFFAFSFVTPIFSQAGLVLLQSFPVPAVTSDKTATEDNSSTASAHNSATAYVVLGGGLTTDTDDNIVVNDFTLSRLQTALRHYQQSPLPIVLTGVESHWMQDWLLAHDVKPDHIITENASMNTCENARFTAKRIPDRHVYLVTGSYHMTRARRQFALNGITTQPLPAPLPDEMISWTNLPANYRHSRRTLYEIGAYLRDVWFPQSDCRSADEVSMETLKRSRKPDSLKTF